MWERKEISLLNPKNKKDLETLEYMRVLKEFNEGLLKNFGSPEYSLKDVHPAIRPYIFESTLSHKSGTLETYRKDHDDKKNIIKNGNLL